MMIPAEDSSAGKVRTQRNQYDHPWAKPRAGSKNLSPNAANDPETGNMVAISPIYFVVDH
jgi:hypothetical protein